MILLHTACMAMIATFLLRSAIAAPLQADGTGPHVSQLHALGANMQSLGGIPDALLDHVAARAADAYASGMLYRRLIHGAVTHPMAADEHDSAASAHLEAKGAWNDIAHHHRPDGSHPNEIKYNIAVSQIEDHEGEYESHVGKAHEHRTNPSNAPDPDRSQTEAITSKKVAWTSAQNAVDQLARQRERERRERESQRQRQRQREQQREQDQDQERRRRRPR